MTRPDNLSVPISGKRWEPKLLEYNADTPSLQLESGILSHEWFLEKYSYSNKHQSNFIDVALTAAIELLIQGCEGVAKKSLAIITLNEDDENTSVMRYIQMLWSKVKVRPDIVDIQNLRIIYDENNQPTWQSY